VPVAGGVAGAAGSLGVVAAGGVTAGVAGPEFETGQYVAANMIIRMTAAIPIHRPLEERRSPVGRRSGLGLLKSFVMKYVLLFSANEKCTKRFHLPSDKA
jgi:hypothetical protein